jgi:hypothetical protein
MHRQPNLVRVLLALVPFLTVSPTAEAVATWNRVFMSTTGNDSNNCSDPATPCRTFIGAQAQTNVGGEIIAMATGGYGQLNVTQSATINGPAGVVIFSNYPVTVNAPGATVVLRGLTIDGTGQVGTGITVTSVGILHVESCVITGWVGSGGDATGDGIYFNTAGQLFIKDTMIRGNGNVGVFVEPTSGIAQASMDRCRLDQNHWGLISGGSTGNARTTIRDSVASGNANNGLYAVGGGELNVEGCLVAHNGAGLVSIGPGSTLRASNCIVTDNNGGLETAVGGSLLSRSNNTVEGNTFDGTFTGTYSAK